LGLPDLSRPGFAGMMQKQPAAEEVLFHTFS
jgi:hypothetical protein